MVNAVPSKHLGDDNEFEKVEEVLPKDEPYDEPCDEVRRLKNFPYSN